ncbi:MAG: hypothetical protein V3S29_04850 [bacterium]
MNTASKKAFPQRPHFGQASKAVPGTARRRKGISHLAALLLLPALLVLAACPASEEATFTVGGTVSGLDGTLVLRNNGADDLTIEVDGAFTFVTALAEGAAYEVTLASFPAIAQNCGVATGSGTLAGAAVTDVAVTCSDKAWLPSHRR